MPKSQFTKAYASFLKAMIAARKEAGLTQTQLARAVGKPQPVISNMERGIRRMDVIEYCAIARALGREPHELLEEIETTLPRKLDI